MTSAEETVQIREMTAIRLPMKRIDYPDPSIPSRIVYGVVVIPVKCVRKIKFVPLHIRQANKIRDIEKARQKRMIYWTSKIAFDCPGRCTAERWTINDCFDKCHGSEYFYNEAGEGTMYCTLNRRELLTGKIIDDRK